MPYAVAICDHRVYRDATITPVSVSIVVTGY